ncbi:MAG: oligoribonuclease [Myxococcota bacterium]
MTASREPLVWLDMEMTGLDPETDVPVEVAVVVTDPELAELESYEAVIWQPERALEGMQPIVRKMHTENGLIDKISRSPHSLLQVERELVQLVARWCKPQEGVLAGNSIHQDRRFIVRHFPTLNGYLHYRMVDVSTLKEIVKRWYEPDRLPEKGVSDHTALSDIRASISELRHYRQAVFQNPS